MTPDEYLRQLVERNRVNTGIYAPARSVQAILQPIITRWANGYLVSMEPSGSFAKGTAVVSGTDIDLFLSLSSNVTNTLKEIYDSLASALTAAGYSPRRQNVSLGISVAGHDVDLVPAKRQDATSQDHSLYRSKADTWTKTNVTTHINAVKTANRIDEIIVLKTWRNQKGIEIPSFYLELVAIEACRYRRSGDLAANVWVTFEYIRDSIETALFIDPANTNNRISDDLTVAQKRALVTAANTALAASNWGSIVK